MDGVKYVSVHESGIYPGTGEIEPEVANIQKISVPSDCTAGDWLQSIGTGLDFLIGERTEMLIVSIGYDGLSGDQLGGMQLSPADYGDAVRLIQGRFAASKTMYGLEGGYNLGEIAQASRETMIALL